MAMGVPSSSVKVYLSRSIDAAIYSSVIALFGALLSGVLGFLLLGSLNGVKFLLFVAGFIQIGIGVAQLWPSDISDVNEPDKPNPDEISRVQLVVDWLAPTDRLGLPPDERFEHGVRQFLAGMLLLVISFSMEAMFGVTG
jgi:hypothetical protein